MLAHRHSPELRRCPDLQRFFESVAEQADAVAIAGTSPKATTYTTTSARSRKSSRSRSTSSWVTTTSIEVRFSRFAETGYRGRPRVEAPQVSDGMSVEGTDAENRHRRPRRLGGRAAWRLRRFRGDSQRPPADRRTGGVLERVISGQVEAPTDPGCVGRRGCRIREGLWKRRPQLSQRIAVTHVPPFREAAWIGGNPRPTTSSPTSPAKWLAMSCRR